MTKNSYMTSSYLVANSKTKNFELIMKSLLSNSAISTEHNNLEDILSLSPAEQERRMSIGLFEEFDALIEFYMY